METSPVVVIGAGPAGPPVVHELRTLVALRPSWAEIYRAFVASGLMTAPLRHRSRPSSSPGQASQVISLHRPSAM
jgi:hypothetical protein